MNLFNGELSIKLAFLIVIFGLTGCAATKPMALNSKIKTVDVSSKSVVLMTLDVYRTDKSRFVPNPQYISFERPGGADGKPEVHTFNIGDAATIESVDGRQTYLLSIGLEPGKYKLNGVRGDANAFPFHGFFFVPLMMDIEIQRNSVSYIGRVKAELRPSKEKEFRAGGTFPLVDQAVTGVSGGTFDVVVEDLTKDDIKIFKSEYPVLNGEKITTALLPQFDRVKVQHWWDQLNSR